MIKFKNIKSSIWIRNYHIPPAAAAISEEQSVNYVFVWWMADAVFVVIYIHQVDSRNDLGRDDSTIDIIVVIIIIIVVIIHFSWS